MAKLLVLDGNSLVYRAFFAIPDHMSNSDGEITNAVFGFTSMLVTLIRDQQPDGLAVCFDRPEPTFRHKRQPAYKAQRDKTPEDLVRQMDVVRRLLKAMNIPVVELPGYEADDLLATLATEAYANGDDVVVVSGDRDTFQLPNDPHIQVLYTLRGVSEYVLLDEAGVSKRVGVHPTMYTQYAAMRGDKSDNLPGVPGVGEKTAAKLLAEHGDLDGIFSHLDEFTPKLRQNLSENEELVRENLILMALQTDVPIEKTQVDVKNLRWLQCDVPAIVELFTELEFSGMFQRLAAAAAGTPLEELLGSVEIVEADAVVPGKGLDHAIDLVIPGTAAEAVKQLASAKIVSRTGTALDYRLSESGDLSELAIVLDPGSALCLSADLFTKKTVADQLKKMFEAAKPRINVHHAKPLMAALAKLNIKFSVLQTDTHLAAYLADPATSKNELGELLQRFCGFAMPGLSETKQGSLNITDDTDETDESDRTGDASQAAANTAASKLLAARATAIHHLATKLELTLGELSMTPLYEDIERPLIAVLQKMETTGVRADRTELTALGKEFGKEAAKLTAAITKAAGHEFNVNSPKELSVVLFGELGLTAGKRTASGGYSTNATTLEGIRTEHAIVDLVLQYREITKLQSTCEKTLLSEIEEDGRIHAIFHQAGSRTGRLSSEEPNLHAIPVRGEHGLRVRRAFVPSDGFELLVADYDQIELRVVAHLSQDPGLIAMFDSGEDVHSSTAAAVFGVEADKVTSDMRSKAKMVSYGLIYGMGAFGLGQRLGIETREAGKILNAYFDAFSGVQKFMTEVVEQSRERGYTETMFGRRRPFTDLRSRNQHVKRAAERQAMNAPVQGLAADIFKIALLHLDAALSGTSSTLVLQVHDEVLLEVAPDKKKQVAELTADTMKQAVKLSVPLEVNVGIGANWADAKA